jgi:MFS family permease
MAGNAMVYWSLGMSDGSKGRRVLFWGITWNIVIAGIVSFFMDVSSEMAYAVGPLFLTAMGASAGVIGLVEGIAEATAALFKYLSGRIADKAQRYKPLVTIGYLISALSRPIMAVAPTWRVFLGGRIVDRFGKGVRTAPRDAIIAASADKKSYGKAFGFHRAMDQSGAILGPLLASAVLFAVATSVTPGLRDFRTVIWLALIPGLLAVVATLFLVETGTRKAALESAAQPEPHHAVEAAAQPQPKLPEDTLEGDTARYWYFLAVMFVFSIGNSSNAFLILRSKDLGMSEKIIPIAYAMMNVVYVAASIPWGVWADKIGFRRVILVGFGVFAVVYFLIGAATQAWMMWALFAAYGLFESAFEGQSRAYLARLAKTHLRGTSFGLYHMLLALTVFPASFIAGLLYKNVSPSWAFWYGAIAAAAAFVMLAAESVILPARAIKKGA